MKLPFYRVEVYGEGIEALGDLTSGPFSFITIRIVFAFCKSKAADKAINEVKKMKRVIDIISSSPSVKICPGDVQALGILDFLSSKSTGIIFFNEPEMVK